MQPFSSDDTEVIEADEADAPRSPEAVSVVAAVTVVAGVDPQTTLQAVEGQDYAPASVQLIGTQDDEAPAGVVLNADIADMVAALDSSVDYVWILHGDAQPRPDALRALVAEAERFEASLAGSKLLIAGTTDTLESVGSATDVFGEPYSGLDEGEVDLEQYDVVRDVAFVSSVSILVRRDLLRGLRGLDSALAPVASGLDLSQRVRIAGGRVIVVPSSEVFHERRCGRGDGGWREQSGRLRAMLKSYRPVTLAWIVPFAILVGIADSLGSLLLGRWRLGPRYLLTWGWNIARLPSTIGARRNVARVRQVGDEELFRYQVRGSVRLRQVGSELSDRLLTVFDDDRAVARRATEMWGSATTWGVFAALVLVLLGIRTIFFGGLPVVGFSLPFEDPLPSLERFFGGWNAAGLGSAGAVHPVVGPTAVAQFLTLGNSELARSFLTLTAFVLGVLGVGRLASRLGVAGPGAYLGGVAALFGLPAALLARDGRWGALVAIGLLPWALASVVGSAPVGRRAWIGRAGVATFFVALVTSFVPVLGAVPLLFAALLRPLGRFRPRLGIALVATTGAVVGVPFLLTRDLQAGMPVRVVSEVIPVLALGAAVLLAMAARSWRAGAVAAGLAFGGLGAAHFGGPDIQEALLVVSAVGVGLVVAVALRPDREGVLGWSAFVGGALVLVISLAGLAGGRAGLPSDAWGGRIDFVTLGASGVERSLLVAPDPYRLPGESRPGPGFWYRMVDSRGATLDQAYLGPPTEGESELAAVISRLSTGSTLTPGEELAPFGVRWLIGVEETSDILGPALEGQVDMNPFPFAQGLLVFENTVSEPVAVRADGTPWDDDGTGFAGRPADQRLRLAVTGDPGWRPDWQPDGWAGTVSASEGHAYYSGFGLNGALTAAGSALALLGLGVGLWGRRRTR